MCFHNIPIQPDKQWLQQWYGQTHTHTCLQTQCILFDIRHNSCCIPNLHWARHLLSCMVLSSVKIPASLADSSWSGSHHLYQLKIKIKNHLMACAGGLCLCLSCAAAISRTGWNIPGTSAVAISPRLCSQPATNIQSILLDRHPEGLVTGLESALPHSHQLSTRLTQTRGGR